MARIMVMNGPVVVQLREPDEDGDYQYDCLTCGAEGDAWRPLDESLMDAQVHADNRCPDAPEHGHEEEAP